jgi:biotin carboxylase
VSLSVALLLFPQDWELAALPNLRRRYPDVEWITAGFDLFKFPQNAQLLWFDPEAFVEKLRRRYEARGIVAVMSAHEQFGALCAALLAEKLKLPGTPVEAILRAQHKAVAREIHAKALPGSVPAFQVYTFGQDPVSQVSLPYPFFVKPVKAAYSVLAKKVKTPEELRAHTTFAPLEGHIIRRLTKPFNALAKKRLHTTIDGDYMMAEAFMQGEQVNVDGFVCNGEITILGTIDAVMYPGTQAFMRFELPSRIPAAQIAVIEETACKAIAALGFAHGLFNVELFWNAEENQASIIEVNPRVAAQFADLYEKVHGINLFDVLADLSFGKPIVFTPNAGPYGVAASFVYRVFDDTPKYPPMPEQLAELRRRYSDVIFTPDFKAGASRAREQKWLGSHRYALLNLGGANHDDLMSRYNDMNSLLDFDSAPSGLGGFLHAIRKGM